MASRPDDDPPGLPPEWAGFVVPDDISELEAEVALVRAEQPDLAPAAPLRRLVQSGSWKNVRRSGPLAMMVLLVVVFLASLVFLLVPTGPRPPQPRPLAHPRVGVGRPGGLLPDLALPVGTSKAVRLRSLRPAVLLLLPTGCACRALVQDVIVSTGPSRLPVLLVGPGADPSLPANTPTERALAGTDRGGQLARALGATGRPTAVFVRADGTLSQILKGAGPGRQIHEELAGLVG